jgi:L-lactate dehydrogenase complex protein LldF
MDPEEMYVILLDNGRTNLLANPKAREALYCIRCGACLNACPVYKNIGGHSYDTAYSGPIGSVITPHLKNMREYKHLSYASSLCGNCTEVCPVRINLHELLLENRYESVASGESGVSERIRLENVETSQSKPADDEHWQRKNKKQNGEQVFQRLDKTQGRTSLQRKNV